MSPEPAVEEKAADDSPAPSEPNIEARETKDAAAPLAATDASAPPDGGAVAWLQVCGSFLLFMNSWGISNTYGVYQTYYEIDLLRHESPSNISWIGSTQACLLLVVGIATGPLFDLGYFNLLLNTGAFLVVFGMMMTSLCKEYWQVMLAQGIAVGIGFGCLFVPSVAIVSTYFTTKKAFATGVAASGSSLGGVIYALVFTRLQPTIGFAWATRVIAFLALAGFAACVAIMRVRVLPKSTRRLFEVRAFAEVPYTMYSLCQFFGILGMYVPFFYVQSYALEKGLKSNLALYLVTIMNASSIFGRLLPNYLADKIGPLNVTVPSCLVAALLQFCWIKIESEASIIVFCILYGFFSGTFVSLPAPTVVTLSPNLSVVGARMGMCFSLAGLGILLGNPIGGAILKQHGWEGLQLWGGVTIAAATIAAAVSRYAKEPRLVGKA